VGMNVMKIQLKADLALVFVAAFWGLSCPLTKMGLESIEGFYLVAIRFTIAFFVMAPFFWRRLKNIDLAVVKHAAVLAAILFATYVFFTFGISRTSASNAGFLTCISGVFVPLIGFVFLKQKPDLKTILCIVLVLIGIYLLTFSGDLQLNWGDLFCILCSIAFAFHIIATGYYVRLSRDSLLLGLMQLGFVALYAFPFTFIFERPQMPQTAQAWSIVLALSLFSTAFGFILQTAALGYTTPTHAGLVLSLEPLFAAAAAYFLFGELLVPRAYLGALIMLAGIILVEVELKGRRPLKEGGE
jgi:drug/metabolite transporter (DMT)-like permease